MMMHAATKHTKQQKTTPFRVFVFAIILLKIIYKYCISRLVTCHNLLRN